MLPLIDDPGLPAAGAPLLGAPTPEAPELPDCAPATPPADPGLPAPALPLRISGLDAPASCCAEAAEDCPAIGESAPATRRSSFFMQRSLTCVVPIGQPTSSQPTHTAIAVNADSANAVVARICRWLSMARRMDTRDTSPDQSRPWVMLRIEMTMSRSTPSSDFTPCSTSTPAAHDRAELSIEDLHEARTFSGTQLLRERLVSPICFAS